MKEVKDLYIEPFKTLKILKKTLDDGKASHAHSLGELIL